jgi:hypothetical protein
MLGLKTWWLPSHPELSSYTFEGISLVANTGMTVLGLTLGTILFPSDAAAHAGTARFFENMDRPIQPEEIRGKGANPAAPVLALSTMGVGALLIAAGAIVGPGTARGVDFMMGGFFIAVGIWFRRRR